MPLARLDSGRSTTSGLGNAPGLLSLDPGVIPEFDDEMFSSSQLSAFVQSSPSSTVPNLRSNLVFDSNTSDSENVEDSGLNSDVENLNPQERSVVGLNRSDGQGFNLAHQGNVIGNTYSNVMQLGNGGEVNNLGQTFDIGDPANSGQARHIVDPFNSGQGRDIVDPFNSGQARDIVDPFNIGLDRDIGVLRVDAVVGAAFAREPMQQVAREPMQQGIVIEDENHEDENHEDEMPAGDNVDSNSEGKWLSYSELMLDSYPAKSKIIYLKAYKMFERYLKSKKQFVPNMAPTEIQILNYFYYLRHEKNLAPTTLWSTYSRVNACVKRLFGFSLKNFVRVSDVLKSYESGYKVKKASIFSPQEV